MGRSPGRLPWPHRPTALLAECGSELVPAGKPFRRLADNPLVPEPTNNPSDHCQENPLNSGPAAAFPGRCLGTLQAILEHLKNLALPPELAVRPASQPGAPAPEPPAALRVTSPAPAPTAARLNLELIRTVRAQIAVLERRVDALQLVVIINTWPMAQRLWWDLAFDLKMPLLQLSFLRELSRPRFEDLRVDGQSMADVLDRIGLLYAEVEFILIQRTDLIELSNVLEYRLGPELLKLRRFLEKADALTKP
jgi:hypothetical protein